MADRIARALRNVGVGVAGNVFISFFNWFPFSSFTTSFHFKKILFIQALDSLLNLAYTMVTTPICSNIYCNYIILVFCFVVVDGGTRAVIFDKFRGVQDTVVGEGTHLRIPFIQEPIIMDIRSRPRIIHSSTGTMDLQTVIFSLLFHSIFHKYLK